MNPLRRALEPLADVLDAQAIAYAIGGSVASSTFGIGRSTLDIDLVADLRSHEVQSLIAPLSAYCSDPIAAERSSASGRSFNLIHLASLVKLDVFPLGMRNFDRESFQRRVMAPLMEGEGRLFPFRPPEAIIVQKLEWFRLGGELSERQWGDVLGVLRVQGTSLNSHRMRHWAASIGVSDLLQRAEEALRKS